MSKPAIVRKVGFSKEDPSRYDYVKGSPSSEAYRRRESLVSRLQTADVKINQASEYSAKIVREVLPIIVAERKVQTVEFISYNRWKKSADETGNLRGVILRNPHGEVLLYVYGVGLGNWGAGDIDTFILDTLGVSSQSQKEFYNETWPHIDYSAIIELL